MIDEWTSIQITKHKPQFDAEKVRGLIEDLQGYAYAKGLYENVLFKKDFRICLTQKMNDAKLALLTALGLDKGE
jgi:hypothetical protein